MSDWLGRFKIAIINDDADQIEALADEFNEHSLRSLGDIREAQALLLSAVEVLQNKKDSIEKELQKANKAKKYMI